MLDTALAPPPTASITPDLHILTLEMSRNLTVNQTVQLHIAEHQLAQNQHHTDFPHTTPFPDVPNTVEVAVLIIVATIGMIGNFGMIISVLVLHNLRRASNAFLFHQCVLDFIKAAYCLPFAQTMMGHQNTILCSFLGSSYIVFVTTSAFNLLALVMNEAYQFYDLMMSIKDSRNCCCVIFGVFTIWFSSIIMNLGVAFIPSNPSYDREMGQCVFVYGVTRNYVLHLLWIVLVTMAIGCTIFYIRKLHLDIRSSSYYRMSSLVRATVTIDTKVRTASQRRQSQVKEKHHVKHVTHVTQKKLVMLVLLVAMFILFWYPLFIMTATDPHMQVHPYVYKILTIIAWSNPTVTPFILFFMIRSGCCCQADDGCFLDDTCRSGIEEEQMAALRQSQLTDQNTALNAKHCGDRSATLPLHSPIMSRGAAARLSRTHSEETTLTTGTLNTGVSEGPDPRQRNYTSSSTLMRGHSEDAPASMIANYHPPEPLTRGMSEDFATMHSNYSPGSMRVAGAATNYSPQMRSATLRSARSMTGTLQRQNRIDSQDSQLMREYPMNRSHSNSGMFQDFNEESIHDSPGASKGDGKSTRTRAKKSKSVSLWI